MVDQDKSMSAMIQNDEEKEWMLPLLKLRDELDVTNDRHLRDYRRMNGFVQIFRGRNIPGPYTQSSRAHWLRRVLEAQTWIRRQGPANVREIELISLPELHEIRRIWVIEKHEIEDLLPSIYVDATGADFPGERVDNGLVFGRSEMEVLREVCGKDRVHYELARELLGVAQGYRGQLRRAGLHEALEKSIRKHFFASETEAVDRAISRQEAYDKVNEGRGEGRKNVT